METREEDIVIVGAGIAGLTTSLGLYRLGLKNLVLESSDSPRSTGFALVLWPNAWKALDAVGLGQMLRPYSVKLRGLHVASDHDSSLTSSQSSLEAHGTYYESYCIKRKDLLETLQKALPEGTIRYSSKVVSIEESGYFKLIHLADGSILKTKVLIGCDGVNSVVAKFLGLQQPVNVGRSAIRGLAEFPNGHGFESKTYVHFGGGICFGFRPCDEKSLYWFFTFTSSSAKGIEEDPLKMKQFVLSKIGNLPREASYVVERTKLNCVSYASLKLRLPWNLLTGNIVKGNACVAGDALHPMTPDIGQGGCSSLEDGVILARCLASAFLTKPKEMQEEEEFERIKKGLENYAKERRWRSFSLVTSAYLIGSVQQSDSSIVSFFREKWLSKHTAKIMLRLADYDCGQLVTN